MTWSMGDLALWLFLIIALQRAARRTVAMLSNDLVSFRALLARRRRSRLVMAMQRPHDTNSRHSLSGRRSRRPASADGPRKSQRQLSQRAQNFMTFGNTKRPRAAGGNLCRGRQPPWRRLSSRLWVLAFGVGSTDSESAGRRSFLAKRSQLQANSENASQAAFKISEALGAG